MARPLMQSLFGPRRLLAGAIGLLLVASLAAMMFAADALVLAMAATAAPAAVERTIPGDDVRIYNLAGTLHVVGGTGSQVTVAVQRSGADAEKLEIVTGELRGHPTLRVLYPSDRIVYDSGNWGQNSTMRVRRDGTFGDFEGRDVLPGERRQVRVSSRGSGLRAYADLEVRVPRGRKVSVYLGVGRADVNNVDGNLRVDVAAAQVHSVKTHGPLSIDTGSGEVSVTDCDGDLLVDTGSGGVTLLRVRGDQISVDTGSGGVEGEQLAAHTIRVDTGSGSVELSGVKATDVGVDTGSGEVQVDLTSDIDRLSVDTGSGSVTVRAPESLGAQLNVETGSGGIDTDFSLASFRKSHGALTGRIGDGRGTITIETGSGAVRLLKL